MIVYPLSGGPSAFSVVPECHFLNTNLPPPALPPSAFPVVPGEEAGDDMFAMSGDTRLNDTLGMTSEEFAAHSKREQMKAAVEIQLPRGGAGTMEAFWQNAGSSMAGTVVEDEARTTAGASIADKSLWTVDDGTLGGLESPGDEDDSPSRTNNESRNMEIEMPVGGLEEMNNPNRGDRGGSNGGDEGSVIQPTQLDLGDESTESGGIAAFTKRHSGRETRQGATRVGADLYLENGTPARRKTR